MYFGSRLPVNVFPVSGIKIKAMFEGKRERFIDALRSYSLL